MSAHTASVQSFALSCPFRASSAALNFSCACFSMGGGAGAARALSFPPVGDFAGGPPPHPRPKATAIVLVPTTLTLFFMVLTLASVPHLLTSSSCLPLLAFFFV